jgi:hypothetical protein
MLLKWLRDPWHLSMDTGGQIGFCLWALQRDGLKVAPYDRHPDGDRSLRTIGMTEASWRDWHHRVLVLTDTATNLIRSGDRSPATRESLLTAVLPYRSWPGDPAVAARLAELHPHYERVRDDWKRQVNMHTGALRQTPRQYRWWWRQLSAAHGTLPPASVYLLDYPATLIVPYPPKTLILATPLAAIDWPTYARSTLEGIRQLAAA